MAKNKPNISEKLCAAALALAARHTWATITLEQISKHAKVKASETAALYKTRDAILPIFIQSIDQRLIKDFKATKLDGSTRDNLFEILMARFDCLQEDREAYISIAQSLRHNPAITLSLAVRLHTSMTEMLKLAGKRASPIEAVGLLALYTMTCHTWARDTTADLSKTMAALDRNLNRAEKLLVQGEKCLPHKR